MRKSKNLQSIDKLIEIMDELRLECPWDKEQTMDCLLYTSPSPRDS